MASLFTDPQSPPAESLELRDRSSPQSPPTPYQSQPRMPTLPPSRSGIYGRIYHGKKDRGEGHISKFYGEEELKTYAPEGLASIAATQIYYPNFNSHRRYRLTNNRLLVHKEQQLSCLENKLFDLDVEEGGKGSLPFDRERFIVRCMQAPDYLSVPVIPDQKDEASHNTSGPEKEDLRGIGTEKARRASEIENLVANNYKLLKEYYELLLLDHDMSKFSRISRRAHKKHFAQMRDSDLLDDQSLEYLRPMDDFITTEHELVFQRFGWLLYSERPWVVNCLRYICYPCSTSGIQRDGEAFPYLEYNIKALVWSFRSLLGIMTSSLVLTPVGLLYLLPMSKPQSFIVVVVFGLVFAVAMAILERRTSTGLVGLAAYFAVLVTFLSNLEGEPVE